MKRTHLGVQAAIVLAMVAFVSWPQFRPVRAQSIWRYAPNAVLQARANDAAKYSDMGAGAARRTPFALGQTGYTDATGAQMPGNKSDLERAAPYFTPEAVAAAGGRLNALIGFARTSLNVPIPYARVVLRNIRTGIIAGHALANDQGQFSFVDLDANAYIVELLGPDGSVVATSAMVSMARGYVLQTEVRVAASAAAVATSLGNSTVSALPQATTLAASNDVTRTTPALTTQESPGPGTGTAGIR
jgi:hypothetical protein